MFVLLMPCSNLFIRNYVKWKNSNSSFVGIFFLNANKGPFAKCPILLIKNFMFQGVFG